MNWRRTLLIGVPAVAVLGWGSQAVLFGFGVATAAGPALPCDTNGQCDFDVRIERSGLVGCTAHSDYGRINIGNRFKPKLVWKIDDRNAPGKYRFRDDGIKIKDPFDRILDLDDEGHEAVNKYRWHSRNGRFGEFHFDPYVQRRIGWPPLVSWINCDPKDPLIANAGN